MKPEETKQEEKKPEVVVDAKEQTQPVWRKIVISTDGNSIRLDSAEVAGNLELLAILQSLIGHLSEKK